MSRGPCIAVQFKPFRLELARGADGVWAAVLQRIGHDDAPPLVIALSCADQPESAARIASARPGGQPRLWVGQTSFDIPKRQTKRLADWIDEQNRPVVQDGTS